MSAVWLEYASWELLWGDLRKSPLRRVDEHCRRAPGVRL